MWFTWFLAWNLMLNREDHLPVKKQRRLPKDVPMLPAQKDALVA